MGRPSKRDERRSEILEALVRVLGEHGVEGATMARVAREVGVAPGLLHHHFASKGAMVDALVSELVERFRRRTRAVEDDASTSEPAEPRDRVDAYAMAALSLGAGSDRRVARAWVGLLAEAVRTPSLFAKVRRLLDGEVATLVERSGRTLSEADASAILAFILGALVFGAFAPKKAEGFAAPALRRLVEALVRAPLGSTEAAAAPGGTLTP